MISFGCCYGQGGFWPHEDKKLKTITNKPIKLLTKEDVDYYVKNRKQKELENKIAIWVFTPVLIFNSLALATVGVVAIALGIKKKILRK